MTGGDTTWKGRDFLTANMPRMLYIDGISNVRDIGGWTGLNQGLVFRGSYMDFPAVNGYGHVTAAGKAEMRQLGVKTELDLRSASEIYTNSSVLGDDVAWINLTIGSYDLFADDYKQQYRTMMTLFADKDNYPFYVHCAGGADRTATVIFLLECLGGAEEAVMDARTREGFKALFTDLKAGYPGSTLKEKTVNYCISFLGLDRAQVSNVCSILSGNGVIFAEPQLFGSTGGAIRIALEGLGAHTVSSVTVGGETAAFALSDSTLVVQTDKTGIGEIVFDDGSTLAFDTVPNTVAVTAYANGNATVTTQCAKNVIVLAAGYETDGRLTTVRSTQAALVSGTNTVTMQAITASTVKVFVFENDGSFAPVCSPFTAK